MSIATEITRLQNSKADVKTIVNKDKDLINSGTAFIDDETLDDYDNKIAEMQEAYKKFIPIQTTSGTEIQLDNSNNDKALVDIGLEGNTEQDGNPTPDNPVEVKTVTGENTINLMGRNLLDESTLQQGTYNGYASTTRCFYPRQLLFKSRNLYVNNKHRYIF